jgi:hypothetical protein
VLLRGGSAGHTHDRTSRRNRCRARVVAEPAGFARARDAGSVAARCPGPDSVIEYLTVRSDLRGSRS